MFSCKGKCPDDAIEVGKAYYTAIIEVGTLPFGGPGEIEAGRIVLRGFTKHGLERIIERGIKPQQILKILKEGTKVLEKGRFGPQLRVSLEGVTLVIAKEGRNAGKVVTVMIPK